MSTIDEAVELLLAGQLVAFPTETVYGLGADASQAQAVAAIFALKQRPTGHPLIVHLPAGRDPASYLATDVPALAYRLMERFWPGPLTLVLARQPGHASAAAGAQTTIGVRCPDHPLAQALLKAFDTQRAGAGLAAPSANRFGHVSPTTAEHVRDEFGTALALVDGGPCRIGIESTILDLSRYQRAGAVLLRPGAIGLEALAEVLGARPSSPPKGSLAERAAPRVSGSLAAHYAPDKPLYLCRAEALAGVPEDAAVFAFVPAPRALLAPWQWRTAPDDAAQYARILYQVLREFDAGPARVLYVEAPPDTSEWLAVNDRLQRAAHATAKQARAR